MHRKILLLAILVLASVITSLASDLPGSRTSSYYKFIYKLSPQQARTIYKKGIAQVDESYFHTLVDSVPNDSVFNKKLSQGNYLLTWADRNELKFELRSYSDIDVMLHNNYADLMLTISDMDGNAINKAKVEIEGVPVRYKRDIKAYHNSHMNKTGWLEVQYNGFTSYHYLGNSVKKGIRFKKVVYSFPLKYLYIPARMVVYLPWDIVRTISKGRPYGLLHMVYAPFKATYNSIFKPGTYGYIYKTERLAVETWDKLFYKDFGGYMIFSKPKYKPNDTVRFKAFIARPNGTPISKQKLTVDININGKNVELAEIEPNRRGSYNYEFVLHDSLNLRLDKSYRISLQKYGWNTIISRSFRYEDYELKNIKYKMRVDDTNHLRGNPMYVYLKGEDMNGMNVPDGRVKLSVFSKKFFNKLYAPKAFLPDTLFTCRQKLDPVGETMISLPDSVFPPLDFGYEIVAEFLTSDNERIVKKKNIQFFHKKEEIELKVFSDSIHFYYKELNKEKSIKAQLKSFDKNGNLQKAFSVRLPFSMPVNYQTSSFSVETELLHKHFEMDQYTPGLSVSSQRSSNKTEIKVNNPEGIAFNYFIYKRNKEIAKGYTHQLDTVVNVGNRRGCFISLNYQWGGKPYNKSIEIPLYKKQLHVMLHQPKVVYPGQKSDITVEVKDYKNRPVKGVDLTAYGLTKKFSYNTPTLDYYGKKHKERSMFSNYNMMGDKLFGEASYFNLDYSLWNPRMQLDTISFYQFTRPETGVDIQTIPANDSITQLAPFVYKDGEIQQAHFIYIDYMLVHSYVSTTFDPYSFKCEPGYHKIRLRTCDQDITIDSVWVDAYKKTLVSVDPTKSIKGVKVNEVSAKLTYNEQKLIKNKFAKFNTRANYGFIYLEQNDRKYVIKNSTGNSFYGRRYRNPVVAGPFSRGTVDFICKDNYITDFDFESSYEYYISPRKIRMKTRDNFWGLSYLTNNGITPGFGDMLLTKNDIDAMGREWKSNRIQSRIHYNNPYTTNKGNGVIALEYLAFEQPVLQEIKLENILVFKDDNPLFMRIYPASTTRIHDLKPGSYRLFFSMREGYYFEYKNAVVKSNGLNVIRIEEPEDIKKDKASDRIAQIIKDKFSTASFAKNKWEKKHEAEKEIKNTFHQNQLDYSYARTISGQIVDDMGEPLPGVSILIKGTTVGTISDMDGNYALEVPEGKYEITYAFIGFESVDVPLSYSDEVNVQLQASQLALDEVVVVGYGVQKKSAVTGSVATVRAKNALQGRVAGVAVESSGAPRSNIMIRGLSSQQSQSPLVIVDGVPVNEQFGDIDPSMIQDFEVLKDEVATAVYGSRGANGVIIVTTKDGKGIPGLTQLNDVEVPFQMGSMNSIRSNFSDEAFWQPNLVTNSKGKVTFTTTFPDDITSWQTYALAMGPNKTSGQTEGEIKSFKPVSAQLMVPRFLTEGDSVNVIGKSVNYLEDTISVTTSYEVDSIKQKEWQREIARVQVDTLSLIAGTQDTMIVTYSLTRENGYFDGEKRDIPVIPQGVEEAMGEFFTLNTDTLLCVKLPENCTTGMLYLESNPLNIILKETAHLRSYKHLCNEQAASKLITLLNEEKICEYLNKPFKYKDDIKKLIQRLEKSTNSNGVWGWWSGLETQYWISSHVVKAFEKARAAGYTVKYNKEQVKYQLVNDFSLRTSYSQLNIIETLEMMKQDVDLKSMAKQINDSLFGRMDSLKFAIIKQKLNMPVDVTPFIKNKRETLYGNYFWGHKGWSLFSGQIQETLLMYQLLKNNGQYKEWLPLIRNFFYEKRKNNGWRNTYESALIIDHMLPELLSVASIKNECKLIVNTGSKREEVLTYPFTVNLKNNDELTIEKAGNQVVFAGWHSKYFNTKPQRKDDYFDINTRFVRGGDAIDKLVAGEKVTLQVEIEVKKKSDYLMLEIPIPSVCSYDTKPGRRYNEAHREYYKDRVFVYYSSLREGDYTVNIDLVPRYTGKVKLNPAKMEHMYFPIFYGNNELKNVMIKSE